MFQPSVPTMSVAELPADACLLDVREDEEWVAGHAPGALHVPMSELSGRIDEVPRDRRVVVVCRSGHRSAAVASFLARSGWQAYNLDGGMDAWAATGRPLEGGTGAPATIA